MAGLIAKLKNRLVKANQKFEEYQDAITFAAAGESGVKRPPETQPKEKAAKLLVMGQESTFSKEIIDYAVDMAQRMDYDIVALNTAPLSCEAFKFFSFSHNKVCDEFAQLSAENSRPFKLAAEARGVPFEHKVMFNEPEAALESITHKDDRIAFVISETIEDRERPRQESEETLRPGLFVYSVV